MRKAIVVLAHYQHNDDGTYSITDAMFTDLDGDIHSLFIHPIHRFSIGGCICDIVTEVYSKGYYIPWVRQFGGRWYNILWNNVSNRDDHEWHKYGVTDDFIQIYNNENSYKVWKAGERK